MTDSSASAEANPLRQSLPRTRVPDPCTIVLFGATGDLTHRKLVPALYRLALEGHMPNSFAVVGVARREWSDDQFRDELKTSFGKDAGSEFETFWPQFAAHLYYSAGDFDNAATYAKLKERLQKVDSAHA